MICSAGIKAFTLDRDFYTHPEIFERDLERIYRRRWLFAGHISRIPNARGFLHL